MSENKPLFEVEAQPPTPEEIERQRVREEYRAKLAEKLKDPEFRKIEGFPIGTDEAILALSDPPYYTACPNPFIEEWLKGHGKPFNPDTDDYHREPFAADVSEGKNHPIYNAHSYHTKVPHRAIMRYILHYTEPGDVVYDGFCGTGMTGVAARLCGERTEVEALGYKIDESGLIWEQADWEASRAISAGRANPHPHLTEPAPFSKLGARYSILNDLSPAATFIARNYNSTEDATTVEHESMRVVNEVESETAWMYQTLHRQKGKWNDEEWAAFVRQCADGVASCGNAQDLRAYVTSLRDHPSSTLGNAQYFVWSDVLHCPACSASFTYYDVAVDMGNAVVHNNFTCPACGAALSKKTCDKVWTTEFDTVASKPVASVLQRPVLVNYAIGKSRFEQRITEFDVALNSAITRLVSPKSCPLLALPAGYNLNQPIRSHGINYWHQFFSFRNLVVIELIKSKCVGLPQVKLLLLDILDQHCSKRNRYLIDKHHPTGTSGGPLSNTLAMADLWCEVQPTAKMKNAIRKQAKAGFGAYGRNGSSCITTASTAAKQVPDASVDFVFVDPPFGGNIMYSDVNWMVEACHSVWTNTVPEAIANPAQDKDVFEYGRLISRCFASLHSALKPGRFAVIEFHNSSNAVWNAIQNAIQLAGFAICDVSVLEKGLNSTIHQDSKASAVNKDLIITVYRAPKRLLQRFSAVKGEAPGVKEFLLEHLERLPPVVATNSGVIERCSERTRFNLFDRMVAFHLQNGAKVPMTAASFYGLLEQEFYQRDGMYFLPSQVVRYDALKSRGVEVEQLSIFVRDEKSAVQWVRNELEKEPHTLGELTPKFMQASQDWGQHEVMPELRDLLQQYFIREDDETWVVPDPDNEKHLEEVRRKAMLREFMEYVRRPGQLKLFRTEAVLAGFAHCWETKQYDVIVGVCEKIPPKILQEIQDLVMFYDIAKERAPEKIAQFEFKWE